MIVYLDGKYIPPGEARISPLDRGLLHGIGAFETLRSYNGSVFMLDEHVQRLRSSLPALGIQLPSALDSLEDILGRLLSLNGLEDARLRVTVTDGHDTPNLLCTAEELPPYGEELYRNGASVIIINDPQRYNHRFSRIKSTSYLGNILIREEARKRGALEAIINDPVHGPIECSMSNLFIVEDGKIVTSPLSLPILPGITRAAAIKTAAALELPIDESTFTADRLLGSDEVFITNSLMEVMPVIKISETIIGDGKPGRTTLKLLRAYKKNAREEKQN